MPSIQYDRARDICDAYGVTVYEFDGSLLHWRAATGCGDVPLPQRQGKAVNGMGG